MTGCSSPAGCDEWGGESTGWQVRPPVESMFRIGYFGVELDGARDRQIWRRIRSVAARTCPGHAHRRISQARRDRGSDVVLPRIASAAGVLVEAPVAGGTRASARRRL